MLLIGDLLIPMSGRPLGLGLRLVNICRAVGRGVDHHADEDQRSCTEQGIQSCAVVSTRNRSSREVFVSPAVPTTG